jgi:hypothetical protein
MGFNRRKLEDQRRRRERRPLWVKSGHRIGPASCPLYPQKRTLPRDGWMSPLIRPTFLSPAARQCIRSKRIPLADTSDKNESADAVAMPMPMAVM